MANVKDLKVGSLVKIIDGSFVVRLDKHELRSHIGTSKDIFKVLWVRHNNYMYDTFGDPSHNIHIQNTKTGAIYLHSACSVKLALPVPIKIVIVPDFIVGDKVIMTDSSYAEFINTKGEVEIWYHMHKRDRKQFTVIKVDCVIPTYNISCDAPELKRYNNVILKNNITGAITFGHTRFLSLKSRTNTGCNSCPIRTFCANNM